MNDTILITGAARGLGLAMTAQLLERGCRICAVARAPSDRLEQLRARYPERLSLHVADVSDEASVQRVFAELAQQLDGLDAIINNAVIYLDGSRPTIEEADLSICARTFEVNSVGPLRVAKHGLGLLRKGKRKLLVNVSSEAGSIGDCQRKTEFAYCMSKSALNMGSKLLSNYLQPEGIDVLVLHPGWFNSSGQGPAPISAEQAAVKVLETILKARRGGDPIYVGPDGAPLPW